MLRDSSNLWVADQQDGMVYRYLDGATWLTGQHPADATFSLNAKNKDTQGLAMLPEAALLTRPSSYAVGPGAGIVSGQPRFIDPSREFEKQRLEEHADRSTSDISQRPLSDWVFADSTTWLPETIASETLDCLSDSWEQSLKSLHDGRSTTRRGLKNNRS